MNWTVLCEFFEVVFTISLQKQFTMIEDGVISQF